VKGLIPRTGLIVIWGPPKCGKSFWTFTLMMHVALGWEYRGRRVQQGPVVYCAFEGAAGFKARAEAFRQQHKLDGTVIPFYLQPLRMSLVKNHRALIADIKEQIETPVCVVLDTLNRSLDGSESSDEDMSAYVSASDAIREAFACGVIIVHHCGIEGTRPRGHTSLTGAADAQLSIERDEKNNIRVKVEWMKDGPEGDEIFSRLETVTVGIDDDNDYITSCVVLPVEQDFLQNATTEKKPLTSADKIALDLLRKCIKNVGETPPPNENIPADTVAVTIEQWRGYCYQGALTESKEPRSKKKAFSRARENLRAAGFIDEWVDWVWGTVGGTQP